MCDTLHHVKQSSAEICTISQTILQGLHHILIISTQMPTYSRLVSYIKG